MTDWIYCGVHFGLFSVYEWPNDFSEGKTTDHVKRHERDVMNYYIATSRDAESWDLQWIYAGKPLVARGSDGASDKNMVLAANRIVTRDNSHWIYCGGANERHGTGGVFQPERNWAIGLAKLRLDGFISMHASAGGGELLTRPLNDDGFRTTGSFQFADGKDVWAHPVVCHGRLFLRYHDKLETTRSIAQIPRHCSAGTNHRSELIC